MSTNEHNDLSKTCPLCPRFRLFVSWRLKLNTLGLSQH